MALIYQRACLPEEPLNAGKHTRQLMDVRVEDSNLQRTSKVHLNPKPKNKGKKLSASCSLSCLPIGEQHLVCPRRGSTSVQQRSPGPLRRQDSARLAPLHWSSSV